MKKIFLILTSLLIFLIGCEGKNIMNTKVLENRASNIDAKVIQDETSSKPIGSDHIESPINDFEDNNMASSERAEIISKSIANLEEIDKASVIVTNNTAIVGIEMKGELSDRKLIKCKNKVEEKVKQTDKEIKHVAVTAAGELVQRITNMADKEGVHSNKENSLENPDKFMFRVTPTV